MRLRCSQPRIRHWTFAVAAVAPLLCGACGDYASITDLPPIGPITADTALPTVTLLPPSQAIELGDSLAAAVSDDVEGIRAQALVLDTLGRVLWRSDTVRIGTANDTIRFAIKNLPTAFPYGDKVLYTVWAEDASGKLRYAGAHADSATAIQAAQKEEIVVLASRTLRLGEGSKVGGVALDGANKILYFTNSPRNYVGALRIVEGTLEPWKIPVGSDPGLLAYHPFAWGAGPALAVFNRGGNDISVVDLTPGLSGQERLRIDLPLMTMSVGSDTARLRREATSLLLHCSDSYCAQPVLYMGSAALEQDDARTATRSVAIAASNPVARFDVITPVWRPWLPSDESVDVTVRVTTPQTLQDSIIFARSGRSLCGTLAFGSTLVAGNGRIGSPVFIAETGQGNRACGEGGRVLRFDRASEDYIVSAQAVLNYDWDDRLRSVEGVVVNADASLTLLRTADRVFVTDGSLKRLGTIQTAAKTVAFLDGQVGGPGSIADGAIFAAATAEGVEIYETQHFRKVAVLKSVTPIASSLLFLRTDSRGGVVLVGLSETQDAFVLIPTSLQYIERQAESL